MSAGAQRRLRVLMLVDDLQGYAGGAEVALEGLATSLPADRCEVWLCTTRPSDPEVIERFAASGVRHLGLDRRGTLDLLRFRRLVSLLRARPFDVIHAHMFGSNVWGTLFGCLLRVPVIVAHEQTWSYEGRPFRRLLDGYFIGRLASAFVAVSSADRERMVTLERVPRGKVALIPNPFVPRPEHETGDLRSELGLAKEVPLVGTAAILRPQKALDVLIDAFVLLRHALPAARLVIAGDGPCRADLEEQVRAAGVEGQVHFLGLRDDIPVVLRSLDVAALSSDYEGTPLMVLECMAYGTPLVATDVGGLRDLVEDGTSAVLVPRRAPARLAEALEVLLRDEPRRHALAAAARERVGHFTVERMATRVLGLYERLLAEQPRSRRRATRTRAVQLDRADPEMVELGRR